MNLLEHYIDEVLSVKDITENYIEHMMKYYEEDKDKDMKSYLNNVILNDRVYEVVMNIDCYGRKENTKCFWRKSEYENNIRKGYYLA